MANTVWRKGFSILILIFAGFGKSYVLHGSIFKLFKQTRGWSFVSKPVAGASQGLKATDTEELISTTGEEKKEYDYNDKARKKIFLAPESWQIGVVGPPGAGASTLAALLSLRAPVLKGTAPEGKAPIRMVDCPSNGTMEEPVPRGILTGMRKAGFHIHVIDAFKNEPNIEEQIEWLQDITSTLEYLTIKDRYRYQNTKTFFRAMGPARARAELRALPKVEAALGANAARRGGPLDYRAVLDLEEQKAVQPVGLIGTKDILYVLNVNDAAAGGEQVEGWRQRVTAKTGAAPHSIYAIPLKSELELHQMSPTQQEEMRREYDLFSDDLIRLCAEIRTRQPKDDVRRYVPFFLRKVITEAEAKKNAPKKKKQSRAMKYYSQQFNN